MNKKKKIVRYFATKSIFGGGTPDIYEKKETTNEFN